MKRFYFIVAAIISAQLLLANTTRAGSKSASGGHGGGHTSGGHGKNSQGHSGHASGGHNHAGHANGGHNHAGSMGGRGTHGAKGHDASGGGQFSRNGHAPRIGQRSGRNPAARANAPRTFLNIQINWLRQFSARYNCDMYYDTDYDSFYFWNNSCGCYSLLDESGDDDV